MITRKCFLSFFLKDKNQKMDSLLHLRMDIKLHVAWETDFMGQVLMCHLKLHFFDANGELTKDINYAISVSDTNGEIIYQNLGDETKSYVGIKASEGIDTQKIYISSEGMYDMTLAITGTGISDWENFAIGQTMFEIGKSGEVFTSAPTSAITQSSIPEWIKNNAGWWADGQIDDGSFCIRNSMVNIK